MRRQARRKLRLILIGLLLGVVAYGGFEYWRLPQVAYLKDANPKTTAWMEMRAQEAARKGRKFRKQQIWKPFAGFSLWLVSSVLLAEDASFFSHDGFDYDEIRESLKKDWENKSLVRGASTVTQQLAKNLFLSPSKNPVRKIKEVLLTWRIEEALSKRRILELYLNLIEWGDGIFGAEAAAQSYYGKSASDLTVQESALLAAMIINPVRYSPYSKSQRLRKSMDRHRNR